ncbi:MAG TPA: hypothetical protein VLR90_11580 [Blastocatellia bacterium]|nr:hypothetical protein [Blastocatellia bacterium]
MKKTFPDLHRYSSRKFLPVSLILVVFLNCSVWAQNKQTQPEQLKNAKSLTVEAAQNKFDGSRYPYRVPDWLWRDDRRTTVIDEKLRKTLDYDIEVLTALQSLEDSTAADEKEIAIAKKLSGALSLRDLTSDAICFTEQSQGTKLCIQIDPAFDAVSKETLTRGAQLFLKYALDDDIIRQAFSQSIAEPSPMPDKFEMKDGKPVLDSFGRQVFTSSYRLFLKSISRPTDVASFKAQLRAALSTPNDMPALLAISKYTGNVWWGGSWYDFFYANENQLSRLSPMKGFLYIRLNADKLKEGVPQWNDPIFWAAKIAHECLHNLGYWHPNYNNPPERDENNPPGKMAFIVAYETFLYKKADQKN